MRGLEAENQRLKDQVSSFIIQPPIVGQDDAKLTKTPLAFHPLERVKHQMDEEQATSNHGLTKLDDTPDETPENHRKKVKEALKDHEALVRSFTLSSTQYPCALLSHSSLLLPKTS